MPRDRDRIQALSARVVAASRDVRVLSALEWPKQAKDEFLAGWRNGALANPVVAAPREDLGEVRRQLDACAAELDEDDPVERYIAETARSYEVACRMIEGAGTPEFTRMSLQLYGRPGRRIPGAAITSVDAARHFVEVANRFPRSLSIEDDVCTMPASAVQAYLEREIPAVMGADSVEVIVDEGLSAKAAAGSTRVRLRSDACFSPYDPGQLLQHEVFVHSLTAQNGKAQPVLDLLGRGAPRTTATQEGLATFAELITGAVDVRRLERIALRVLAIEAALDGADFVEVFQLFRDAGQPPSESFLSTQRVFRGGDPAGGGVVFTKDAVYLEGLLTVYAFFQWCVKHERLDLAELLFAGRMTLGDVFALEEARDEGLVLGPRVTPPWFRQVLGLVGFLAFADFAHGFDLDALECPEAGRLFRRSRAPDPAAPGEGPNRIL